MSTKYRPFDSHEEVNLEQVEEDPDKLETFWNIGNLDAYLSLRDEVLAGIADEDQKKRTLKEEVLEFLLHSPHLDRENRFAIWDKLNEANIEEIEKTRNTLIKDGRDEYEQRQRFEKSSKTEGR